MKYQQYKVLNQINQTLKSVVTLLTTAGATVNVIVRVTWLHSREHYGIFARQPIAQNLLNQIKFFILPNITISSTIPRQYNQYKSKNLNDKIR